MFYFEVSVLVSILNSKKRHTKVLMNSILFVSESIDVTQILNTGT